MRTFAGFLGYSIMAQSRPATASSATEKKFASSTSSGSQGVHSSTKTASEDAVYHEKSENISAATDEIGEASETGDADDSHIEYPKGVRLALIIIGLALAVFLVFLDMTLIATAIPAITNQFNSLQHVGWYGSAYMLSVSSFRVAT